MYLNVIDLYLEALTLRLCASLIRHFRTEDTDDFKAIFCMPRISMISSINADLSIVSSIVCV